MDEAPITYEQYLLEREYDKMHSPHIIETPHNVWVYHINDSIAYLSKMRYVRKNYKLQYQQVLQKVKEYSIDTDYQDIDKISYYLHLLNNACFMNNIEDYIKRVTDELY